MEMTHPRIAVIDDERHLRELLEIALGEDGFEVRSAPDGRSGLTLVKEWRPDAIVLDAKGDVDAKIRGLESGADDYLAKPFEVAELVVRLHAALRRPRLEHRDVLTYADISVDLDRREVKRGSVRIDLSAREFQLLVTLVRNPERVFTRDQLLDLVWGSDREVGPGAVETYVSYLRAKIDNGFEPRLIRTVRGAGYALRAD